MMGGAVGLAILASIAGARTDRLREAGGGEAATLNGGYHLAFLVGAAFIVAAAAVAAAFLRPAPGPRAAHG